MGQTTTPAPSTFPPTDTTTVDPGPCPPGTWGNVPHPELCNSFYLCTGSQEILQLFCSEGFEFDPVQKTCVAIAEGGCTLGSGSTAGPGTTPDGSQSTTTTQTTTDGDVTSSTTSNDGTTTTGVTTPEPTTDSSEIDNSSTTPDLQTTTEEVAFNPCPEGVFGNVPNPNECSSYFLCVNGEAIPFNCAEGLEYDPESKTCVVIAEGGCTMGPGTPTQSPSTPDGFSTTPANIASSTQSVEDEICSGVFGTIPHPELCNSFYICDGDKSLQLFCVEGYEYDPESKGCVEIAEGGCTLQSPTTTEAAVTEPPICPEGLYGNIPHPQLCNAFYMCTGGQALELFCSEGFEFDPESRECAMIAEGGCTLGSQTTPATDATTTVSSGTTTDEDPGLPDDGNGGEDENVTTTVAPTTESPICPPDVFGNVPHPDRCDAFYFCSGGTAHLFTCSEGMEFDRETKMCVPIAEGGCTLSQGSTPGGETPDTTTLAPTTVPEDNPNDGTTTESPFCPSGVFGNVPHPDRCDAFYFCSGGNAYLVTCSEGHEYDPETKLCVPIAEGGCTLGQGTTPGGGTTVPDVTSTAAPDVSTTTEAITEPTTVADDTSEEDSICPSGVFGNVPHPDRCDAFYFCSGGTGMQFNCSAGLEFDPESKVCVPIAEGGCTLGQGTTPGGETTVPDVTSTAAPDTTVSTTAAPEVTVTSTAAPDTTVSTTAAPEVTVTSTAAPETTVSTTAAPETTVSDVTPTAEPVTTTLAPTTMSDDSSEVSTTTEAITEPTTVADDTSEEDSICPPGVFGNVAHPDRCDAFYFCSGGTGMQFNCSAGLEFDPESKTCAPIAEGGCTLGKGTTEPDVTPTAAPETTVSTTAAPDTTVKEVTSTAAPDTTVSTTATPETTVSTTVAPETTVTSTAAPDTTVSTTAAPETTVTSTTAPETTVSDVTPTVAPVTTTLAPTESDDNSEGSTTTEAITEPTTVADDTSEEDPICPPGVFGNMPHPDRCDAFYFCSGGNALLVNCSGGLEFDRESMVCAPIVEGRCLFGQVTEAKPETTTQVPSTVAETTWKAAVAFMCPDNEDRFFADPNSCNRFFRCIEGYGLQMHCPTGEEYDASQEACVPITEDGCTSKRK
uniref:SFRICE_008059 n=1 Tax=Spodoptera frugiperda TaxID=7108 RepID=A0A2H1VW49_SPOFR